MKIQIWSDFSCPFCYIGKTRLEKAIRKNQLDDKIELEFKSYQLNPDAAENTDLKAIDAFSKEKGVPAAQVREMFENVTRLFNQEGIKVNMEASVMTNTFNAHRLAKYARSHGMESALTARLMKAYFEDGLNLADPKTLLSIARKLDLDEEEVKKVLESNEYQSLVESEIAQAHALGVRGVPFFVINNKYSISGAQPLELFEQAILEAWHEENPLKPLSVDDSGLCTDDNCSI